MYSQIYAPITPKIIFNDKNNDEHVLLIDHVARARTRGAILEILYSNGEKEQIFMESWESAKAITTKIFK